MSNATGRMGEFMYVVVVLWVIRLSQTFCIWINTMYNNIESVVQVNGFFLESFMIECTYPARPDK